MSYTVAIRNNATNEVRPCVVDNIEWTDGQTYLWTDGTYGCDCNRSLFWQRAGGADPDFDDVDCGEGAFTVLYAELPDGRHIPIDEAY